MKDLCRGVSGATGEKTYLYFYKDFIVPVGREIIH